MRRTLLVLALAIAGCGGGDQPEAMTPGQPTGGGLPAALNGAWVADAGNGCARGLAFDTAKGTYTEQFLCPLETSGQFGTEMETGTALMTWGSSPSINFQPTKVSCASHTPVRGVVSYNATATTLALTFTNSIIVFQRANPGASMGVSGTIFLGCWDMGKFTQHDLGPTP